MNLQRIVQHLRQQNWTAVFIEFVIVVVGVFIGMQVSNWNAAQADKRLGRTYTERLAKDLRRNLTYQRAVVGYYSQVLQSVERANALLRDPGADPKALIMHAYRASEIVNSPRTSSTWDEIVSSGDTGLLPRSVLESGLSDYFAGDSMRDAYDRIRETDYRRRVRSIIPLEVQDAIRDGCSDVTAGSAQVIAFVPNCKIAVDDRVLVATAAALRADPQLVPDLRYQYSTVYSMLGVLRSNAIYLEDALTALDAAAVSDGGAGR